MNMGLDFDTIRTEHPLPEVVGAVTKLQRAGNEWKACCPLHADRTPSFTIYSRGQRFQCFGCGAQGDVLDFVQQLHGVDLQQAVRLLTGGDLPSVRMPAAPANDDGDRIAEARSVWEKAAPIQETLAETYLRARGIAIPLPPSLRFAALPYGKGNPVPCLVAAVSNVDGQVQGVQRTYLNLKGTGKANVPVPKLSMGRVAGGAVRLAGAAERLTVCEGIEDGLTIAQETRQPVWVACGSSMLRNIVFPAGTRAVVIGGDNDSAGREAVEKAAASYAERGLVSSAFYPAAGFKDFNQQLMEGGAN